MPLTAHRRHAITSLLSVLGPICLYQYLLAPNLTVFLIRLVIQTRSSTPRIAHPSSSLLTLSLAIITSNLLAVFLHWLDHAVDTEGSSSKGLILDFVGLRNHATFTQTILIDLFLTVYQLATLYVAYLSDPLPGGEDQLLIPSSSSSKLSGKGKGGRRRSGSRSRVGRTQDQDRDTEPIHAELSPPSPSSSNDGAGLGLGLGIDPPTSGSTSKSRSRERQGMNGGSTGSKGVIDLSRDDGDDDDGGDGEAGHDRVEADDDDENGYERESLLHRYRDPHLTTTAYTRPPPPLIFIIPHLHTFLYTILTHPSPITPVPSFAGATPTLGVLRGSRELDRAEEGLADPTPSGGTAGVASNEATQAQARGQETRRIPGGLSDRGFW